MKHFAYLDIEATHTNWHDAQIIEIAFIIKDENGKDLDFFQSLIRPQNEITHQITELTGISQQMLDNAPEFHKVAAKVYDKLKGCIIVAHKVDFDYDLLTKEFKALDLNFNNKKLCTLKLSQRLIPELASYSLKSLCELLQIKLHQNHRAYDDAQALYHLHSYLRLINGELSSVESFLPQHKKQIEKSAQRPGVIIFEGQKFKEIYKTENIQVKLKELLAINPKNKARLASDCKIKTIPCASLIEAGLIKTRIERPIYPYCIYKVKNNQGKLILRIGKTNLKKKALYFTHSKEEAKKIIKSIIKPHRKTQYAYQDSESQQSEIIQENILVKKEIKKLVNLEKNYLIRSTSPLKGQFQYTIIKGNKSFAQFKSKEKIKALDELSCKKLKFKNMGPREYMAFNHSLAWIKNQKTKTDELFEIKKLT